MSNRDEPVFDAFALLDGTGIDPFTYAVYTPAMARDGVSLKWATPDGDQMIADMARVSVPGKDGHPAAELIRYMADHKHWSPFEMVSMCVEIKCPRDISRQILRHRTFAFQEFSQRYSRVTSDMFVLRERRNQHPSNRQMSVDCRDEDAKEHWFRTQAIAIDNAREEYEHALRDGVAKEVARVILPEGNTMSRMFMTGTLRSWLHYVSVRTDELTVQREHVWGADHIRGLITEHFPLTAAALL